MLQEAIPYNSSSRLWALRPPRDTGPSSSSSSDISTVTSDISGRSGPRRAGEDLKRLVSENPVLVVGRAGCCMCHVVCRLLLGLGVNPSVCEVNEEVDEAALIEELTSAEEVNRRMLFPAVFIGGRLVGGLDRLMAAHISGDLVPILKEAGALWL